VYKRQDDVYAIPAEGGVSRRLTFHNADDIVCDWTAGGGEIIFSSRRLGRYPDYRMLYRVPLEGGTPAPVMAAFGEQAAVSTDGEAILYTREGIMWSRRHYRGSGAGQVWLYRPDSDEHIAITDTTALKTGDDYRRPHSCWPIWGPDGSVYLASERDGTVNIWRRDPEGGWGQVTHYSGDGIRFPAISRDGRVIAYEQGLDLYIIEDGGPPRRLDIIAPLDNPDAAARWITYKDKAERLAFSPDGRQMLIEVRGEVFAGRIVGDEDKRARGRANPLSGDHPYRDGDFAVSAGGDSVVFVSDREGSRDLYLAYSADPETAELAGALRVTIERLTSDPADEHTPRWSPDGGHLAFIRGKGDLFILDLQARTERQLLEGWSLPQYAWSPDGSWIAFTREDNEYNSDVFIIPVEGGAEVNISRHPDEDELPVWSSDGRRLAFRSRRRENNWDLHFVFLMLEDHRKSAADWAEEARAKSVDKSRKKDDGNDKKKKSKEVEPPVEVLIDTTDIYRRIRSVTRLSGEEGEFAISPDGQQFVFSADHEGEKDLYIVKWTGEELKRLTKGGAEARFISFDRDGKLVRFLDGKGLVKSVGSDGKKEKTHPFEARVRVDRQTERRQKFSEIWRTLNDRFYDPDFHGYDWTALGEKYRALIEAASCEQDFGDLVRMMFGELNCSHMGYSSPYPGESHQIGRLGLDFDFTDPGPGLLVAHVQPRGPCDREKSRVHPGERLVAVGGVRIEPGVNLNELLVDMVGERTELVVSDGKDERRVVVRPMGDWVQGYLRYDEWVTGRRQVVDSLSEGRLGYLHIRGMGDRSLARFEAQLFSVAAGREGLVIDVRYNSGGWITDHLLTMLQVRRHAVTYPRDGGPGYPQGRLPFYAWVNPIVVLCNEHSFSNAEIFSHSIKTLGRGTLVGVPTPGGVISTGGEKLIDGSSFRVPLRGWYSGSDPTPDPTRRMEGNGAVPDIVIPLRPGQMATGDDLQLREAAHELLGRLDAGGGK